MRKKLKEQTGAISIFTIMVLVVLLPLAFWVGIELPKMHEANQRVKDAVDSASSSSVTIIDESEFADGKILLNENEIEYVAKEIFGQKMGITYQRDTNKFDIPPGSSVNEDTEVQVEVEVVDDDKLLVDGVRGDVDVKSQIEMDEAKQWRTTINYPTVVVETKITFKKIGFFGKDMTVTQVGMSQVRLSQP